MIDKTTFTILINLLNILFILYLIFIERKNYRSLILWIICFFMFFAGASYNLQYRAWSKFNPLVLFKNEEDLKNIDMTKPLHIFSQTTKNKEDYYSIIEIIKQKHQTKEIYVTDSICKKVSSRAEKIGEFAKGVDCVLFVSGKHSSNGLYLYNLCKNSNENTFFISDVEDIDINEIKKFENIGISGATSTPMWLMEKVKAFILERISQ